MKKTLLPLATLIISLNSYGFTLDEMIREISTSGYSNSFKELEVERLAIEETKVDLINRDGINFSGSTEHLSSKNKDTSNSNLNLNYDFLAYKGAFDHQDGTTTRELLGVEKDLRDIFYSEKKYSQNIFDYDYKLRSISKEKNIEDEVLSLISFYSSYQDLNLELQLLKELHPNIVNDYNRINKSYKLGTISEVEYLYAKARMKNSSLDIERLEDEILSKKREFSLIYKLDVKGKDIKGFDYSISPTLLDYEKLGSRDIYLNELQVKRSKEDLSYSIYENKWPTINAGTFYDTVNDGVFVSIEFSKDLFVYDNTSKLLEIDIKESNLQVDRSKESALNIQNTLTNTYNSTLKEVEKLKNNLEIDRMEMEIYKLRFEQGTSTYIEYVEKYDDFVTSSIQFQKAKNTLASTAYEIRYRR